MAEEFRTTARWRQAAYNRETNEWDHTWLEAERPVPTIDMFVRQAPPLRITPSRRKRLLNEGQWHTAFGDTHHPFQDDKKLDLAHLLLEELNPVSHTFVGDDNDMAMWSRFESRNEWLDSTQQGIDQYSERLAKVRATLGKLATINSIQGNHDIRMERQIRVYNAELLGLKRANADEELGVLTMEFLLRLDEIGVNYVAPYPEAEVWITDNTKGYHGRKTSSNGSVVKNELTHETVNFFHGHGHSNELLWRTFRLGRDVVQIWGAQLGAFADQDKIPSGKYGTDSRGNRVTQVHNWQAGALAMHETPDGVVTPYLFSIDDSIDIFGKVYKS